MTGVTDIILTAVFPVLSLAVVGAVLGWATDVDVDGLNTLVLYVLFPALIFDSTATASVSGGAITKIFVGIVAFTVVMFALSDGLARILTDRAGVQNAIALTGVFSNAGTFGIPVSAFAFGSAGRSAAVIYVTFQSALMYTVGVTIASRGSTVSGSALSEVLRLPILYAAGLGGSLAYLGAVPSTDGPFMSVIKLTGDAAIPVMLIMLGVQLVRTDLRGAVRPAVPAVTLRLLVAPVAALVIALALGFRDSTVAKVFVLQCAVPASIATLILTLEYTDTTAQTTTAGQFVGTVIFLTTVLGALTVSVLIVALQLLPL
ncbi:AEC family transporter [Halorubrum sp. CSM-61]|uniref:AEC family transporter n=1 Tax=Halorubrum sp. CSM-61 TaxID=2485838 RepID=UPI0013DDB76E|nr:AEC family transporter [Halorubrum sp. CSM-61]